MSKKVLVSLLFKVGQLKIENKKAIAIFENQEKAEVFITNKNNEIGKFKEALDCFYHANLTWIKENSYTQLKLETLPNNLHLLDINKKRDIENEIKKQNALIKQKNTSLFKSYVESQENFESNFFRSKLNDNEYELFMMWKNNEYPDKYMMELVDSY